MRSELTHKFRSKDTGSKLKLVRIIGRLVGGPARQTCLLHERLSSTFHTVLIVGTPSPGENDMAYLLSGEWNVQRVPEMGREISFASDIVAFWRIFRLLRAERPDIVHTHTAKAGALGRLAAWVAGVPVIVHTYHGHVFEGYFSRRKTWVYRQVERVLGCLSTQVIAISESQRRELSCKYGIVSKDKVT